MITVAVQFQLSYYGLQIRGHPQDLGRLLKIVPNEVGVWGGGFSLVLLILLILITQQQAGAIDAQCGGGEKGGKGGEEGLLTADNNNSNSNSSFSLSFCPLCIRKGFDKKFLHAMVRNRNT